MARFRHKPRVQWAGIGSDFAQGLSTWANVQLTFAPLTPVLSDVVADIPILPDFPFAAVPTNIVDLTGQRGYRLRRIVGKIFLELTTGDARNPVPTIVTAGIIIRQVDPNTGAANAATTEKTPSGRENASDPWVWRRSWLLGSQDFATASSFDTAPRNNFSMSGVLDGPHIDQKTNRKVQLEERAFLTFSARNLRITGGAGGTTNVNIITDLRSVITPLSTYGNRGNASR
jgi:hypothetical protein